MVEIAWHPWLILFVYQGSLRLAIIATATQLVISAPTADKDQGHQPHSQAECNGDAQSHSEPTGRADLRIADIGPKGDNNGADRQDDHRGDRHRQPSECPLQGRTPRYCAAHYFNSAATWRKSAMKRRISRSRVA